MAVPGSAYTREIWGPRAGQGPQHTLLGSVEPRRGSRGPRGSAGMGRPLLECMLAPREVSSGGWNSPSVKSPPSPCTASCSQGHVGLVPSCPAPSGRVASGSWVPAPAASVSQGTVGTQPGSWGGAQIRLAQLCSSLLSQGPLAYLPGWSAWQWHVKGPGGQALPDHAGRRHSCGSYFHRRNRGNLPVLTCEGVRLGCVTMGIYPVHSYPALLTTLLPCTPGISFAPVRVAAPAIPLSKMFSCGNFAYIVPSIPSCLHSNVVFLERLSLTCLPNVLFVHYLAYFPCQATGMTLVYSHSFLWFYPRPAPLG